MHGHGPFVYCHKRNYNFSLENRAAACWAAAGNFLPYCARLHHTVAHIDILSNHSFAGTATTPVQRPKGVPSTSTPSSSAMSRSPVQCGSVKGTPCCCASALQRWTQSKCTSQGCAEWFRRGGRVHVRTFVAPPCHPAGPPSPDLGMAPVAAPAIYNGPSRPHTQRGA